MGATVTRSNIVDDKEKPRSDAIPQASVDANCHFRLTKFAICSAHSFSGRSISELLYVPLNAIPYSSRQI